MSDKQYGTPERTRYEDGVVTRVRPKERIVVIGVGGGGGNTLNSIISSGLKEIETVALNTDSAALEVNLAQHKIVLGRDRFQGLGAGNDPEIGRLAAEESKSQIQALLEDKNDQKKADMVFIAAGMGGGTGSGAASVVAGVAKELGILCVAVVSTPFHWEGKGRKKHSDEGLAALRENVDALIVVDNEKLLTAIPGDCSLMDGFLLVDNVLCQAVSGVVNMIRTTGDINVDFADVTAILKNAKTAVIGIGEAHGDNDDVVPAAIKQALNSPLLSVPEKSASGLLYFVETSERHTLNDVRMAAQLIQEYASDEANIIWGMYQHKEPEFENRVKVTIIATGFAQSSPIHGYGMATAKPSAKSTFARPRLESVPIQSQGTQPQPQFQNQPQMKTTAPASNTFAGSVRLSSGDLANETYFSGDDDFDKPAISRRR